MKTKPDEYVEKKVDGVVNMNVDHLERRLSSEEYLVKLGAILEATLAEGERRERERIKKLKAEAEKYPVQGFIKDRADGYNDGYRQALEDALTPTNN